MTYATGGIVRSEGEQQPIFIERGCTLIIPTALAKKWREELDRLNEAVLD